MKNQLRIGISLGIGITLGIGMVAQPDRNMVKSSKSTANLQNLTWLEGLFFKSEVSPTDLYDMALYKGFCQAVASIL